MADRTGIEWTEATWNPVTGCSKVSPGCAHCYAERLSLRFGVTRKPWLPVHAVENIVMHPKRLDQPRRWRRPRLIFVNSMSDLFNECVPLSFIQQVFTVMVEADQHVFRSSRSDTSALWSWHRVFRGVKTSGWASRSRNGRWTERAEALRRVPVAVRFISAEPLLGSLDGLDLTDIHWLIAGGESGPAHRPVQAEWVRGLRDLCREQRVPFFFKQWGGSRAKTGGRRLDGRLYSQLPRRTPQALRTVLAA